MKIQGLKRKAPNARHYFAYRHNGEVYSGINPDYLQPNNTIIRPDVDVQQDVTDINDGKATIPDYEQEIRNFKKIEYNKYHNIAKAILVFCAFALISSFGTVFPV